MRSVASIQSLAARCAVLSVLFLAAACGGGGSRLSSAAPPAQTLAPSSTAFSVLLPVNVAPGSAQLAANTSSKKVLYYSANTQSLQVWVYERGVGQVADVVLSPLNSNSANCSTTSAGTVCNIPLNLAAGTYYCTVETYADLSGHGRILSIQEYIPLTVSSNGTVTTPPWTLWGVPHAIVTTLGDTPKTRATAPGVVTTYGGAAKWSISATDQSGALMVGPGMPTWTVASSNPRFNIAQPSAAAPNVFTVLATTTAPLTTQLTITGSFPQSAINFCGVVGANCTGSGGTLNSIDVASDDWITFAHDYQRTGYQPHATGLSVSTAPQLALRWKVQVPNQAAINANPTVVAGHVIVVTSSPVAVYDFSAMDGTLGWSQTNIPGGSAKPATVDVAAGLVFVGNRLQNSSGALPSTLYALSLADGRIVWQTTLLGGTRSGEVVANGKIYIGTAGGDPPGCVNMGVQRVDEATGHVDWTWILNSLQNPGGGGAVWGAIAYDGSHLIFPTANVCQASGTGAGAVPTADGAAALDLNGNLLWSFVAWAQTGSNAINLDYDTGSGVMIQNPGLGTETASFLNKNGILYQFNTSGLSSPTPGAVLQQSIVANQYFGYGFYGSPTSDGHVTVVGSGTYGTSWTGVTSTSRQTQGHQLIVQSSMTADHFTPVGGRRPSRTVAGYYDLIRGFGPDGSRLWSFQTSDILAGYVGLNNGVAVVTADSSVIALNSNGSGVLTPLWKYNTVSTIDNSPAIVTSGIYAADSAGWVYAITPPLSPN